MNFRSLLLPAVAASLSLFAHKPAKPMPAPAAQSGPEQLQHVLSQLDAASAKFHSAQADLHYDIYTKLVDDHEIQTGSLYIQRTKSGEHMGAIYSDVQPNGNPDTAHSKIVAYDGGTLQMYSRGDNQQVDVFKAGANQAKYESFLTLGFGGSGRDLAKVWNITDQGAETIDGVSTEKLDLVAKEESIRNTFTHVTIWVDPTRGVSLKQIFYAPHGDSRTALYTHIRLNTSIDTKPYEISNKANRINH